MKAALAYLSGLIALISLVVGLLLIITNDGSGFLPDLGLMLGLFALAIGNGITFLLNALYWRLYGAPAWLRVLVVIQVVPALITLGMIGRSYYDDVQNSRAAFERDQVVQAIQADNVARLSQAQAQCGQSCRDRYPLDEQLLDAVDSRAHRAAAQLVGQSAAVSGILGSARRDIWTCEGMYMPGANALEVAVARNDPDMVALLLPVSDEGARRSALWRAAELNQLELVQFLAQAGVPLSIRGDILDQNNTLLVAAASGGALDVGRWLIDSRHFPVNALDDGPDPYKGEAPLHALFRFMTDVRKSPRTPPFLRMLVEHGVDINASFDSAGTLLQEAVRIGDKDMARQLLDAGARKNFLDPSRQAALAALLAKPDERDDSPQPRKGCVQVGAPRRSP